MTANANRHLLPGTVFQGRYRIVRSIKAGSMGAVYEVIDHKTESRRALKVMLPGLVDDPDMRARFVQEAKITGAIESDHIIRVLDADIDVRSGTPFLVMDLLRGEEVGRIVKAGGPLSYEDVAGFLFQAALALDKTHAAGIVHRDLKPQNLFLTYRDDGSPCIKILDFGIAKVFAQRETQVTKAIGTPLYMAPEQIRGDRKLGPQVDIYALGQIAYTMLAGEPYWNEELRAAGKLFPLLSQVVEGVQEAPCVRATRRGVTLPAEFDGWFLKATSVHPEERFESASEAVAALSEVLGVSGQRSLLPAQLDPRGRLTLPDDPPSPTVSWPDAGGGSLLPRLSVGAYAIPIRDSGGDVESPKIGLDPRGELSMAASATASPPRRAAAIAAMGGAIVAGLLMAVFVVVALLRPASPVLPNDVAASAAAEKSAITAASVEGLEAAGAPQGASTALPAPPASKVGVASTLEPEVAATRTPASRLPPPPRKDLAPASTTRPRRSIY